MNNSIKVLVTSIVIGVVAGLGTAEVSAQCVECKTVEGGTGTEKIAPIYFSPEMIRQIAARHPRFAASLASLNKNGGIRYRITKRYWTPVELRAEDVEYFLRPTKESAEFSDRLDAQAQKINKLILDGSVKPIIYAISVKDSSESSSSVKVVRLQVIQGSDIDPPYSSLEITLGEKTSWRID